MMWTLTLLVHCVAAATLISLTCTENAGWKKYFEENPTEFHDLPLTWETNTSVIPSWLGGTYVRNGPAQISFSSGKRSLGSWLDGYAKLHSFKFNGKLPVLFSGKMLEVPTYMDSVAAGELVPSMTLSKFRDDAEEWSIMETMTIAKNLIMGKAFDNSNPAIWRMGSPEQPVYMAVTDAPIATHFDVANLDTLGMLQPDRSAPGGPTISGCAHWMREPGTENSINFVSRMGLYGPYVEVQRFKPEHQDLTKYEVVGTFKVGDVHMVHSFSITENYAVFFLYPLYVNMMSMLTSKFHIMEAVEWRGSNEQTHVVIVNLKSGDVQEIHDDTHFSFHHINAYEINHGKDIILDMSPSNPMGLRDYPNLDNMLNPPKEWSGLNGSTTGVSELTRYHISLDSGKMVTSTFPDAINSHFINRFDFPTINEDYRGKKYCVVYGVSAYDYSRTALIKKNLCDSTKDKVYNLENHYNSEMSFHPNPQGTSEDDGVLITIVFDGVREQSYLLLLDAQSFTPIDQAFLPHNIPWSAHGLHFPEAQFNNGVQS